RIVVLVSGRAKVYLKCFPVNHSLPLQRSQRAKQWARVSFLRIDQARMEQPKNRVGCTRQCPRLFQGLKVDLFIAVRNDSTLLRPKAWVATKAHRPGRVRC